MHRLVHVALLVPLLGAPRAADASACADAWREPLRGAVLRVAHYPYAPALRAYFDLSSVPRATAFTRAELTLELHGEAARTTFAISPREAASPGGVQRVLSLPVLAPGVWELRARLSTQDCGEIAGPVARFAVRTFGWERNGLGENAGVIPPFTPLGVESDRVRAVLREHTIAGGGVWSQVSAVKKPLLAAPMRWEIVANGEPQAILAEPPKLRVVAKDRVAVSAGFRAGPLALRVDGMFEIDGLYRVHLHVGGAPDTRVDRLDLVIPLLPPRATLMNAITDETRIHRLGALPAGPGRVWHAAQAPRRQLDAGFVPYVWVGDEERGIAWLAESTRDFWFAPGAPTSELRRGADAIELRIHFASAPGLLGRNREIAFALQATPVKPRPSHAGSWRLWQLACDAGAEFVALCPLPSGFYWGTASRYGHVTPRDGDESVFRWMADARAGKAPRPPFGAWLDRHGVAPGDRDEALASLEYTMRVLAIPTQAAVVYMNAQGTAWGPEFSVYGDEWRPAPFGDRAGGDEPLVRELPVIPRASYRDRMLWHLDRLLAARAADAVFFDNTFLRASFDDRVGTAYRDERGRLHPGVEIYALRELLRRAQALVFQRRGGWWNVAHLTTTPISAIHGFAGVTLDGEWRYGEDDFQQRFSRDHLRATGLGAQLGTVPVWLPGMLTASGPRKEELRRQLFGLTALHEIRVMDSLGGALGGWWRLLRAQGYGDAECEVSHYWDPSPILAVRGADAEVLAIRCGTRITALVVAFGNGGVAELTVGSAKMAWSCRDLERPSGALTPSETGCFVPLGRQGVRIVELRPG